MQTTFVEMGKRRGRWQIWARNSNAAGAVTAVVAACSADTCDGTWSWPRTEEDAAATDKSLARNFSWED